MFAVIKFNNVQYKVSPEQEVNLPNFEYSDKDKSIKFEEVLLIGDGESISVGEPTVKGASVSAKIIGKTRGSKVRVFKFRAKKRYKKTAGQVQDFVRIKIEKINLK